MNKISVQDTIRFAYAFAFANIGSIIGLIWLPTVLIAVLQFLPYALGIAAMNADQQPSQGAALTYLVSFFGMWLLYAMNAAAVIGLALGTRQGGTSAHFSLGRAEFRLFGAFLLYGLLFSAFYIAFSMGIGLLSESGSAAAIAAQMALTLAWFCALVYAGLRLGFLLVPVVVVEETIDLVRAWQLTAGNFWRLLGISLAILLPLVLIQLVAVAAILGKDMAQLVSANQPTIEAAMTATMAVFDRHMPELIGVSLLLAPFSIGLTMGAAASAYRAAAPSIPRPAV
ncbi:MAG: hypothetical protein ABSD74_16315 [Rhizomicrobium sp.]|jgi:hypothetical protein